MRASWIKAYTLLCAAGAGLDEVRNAIAQRRTGLRPRAWQAADVETWLGLVAVDEAQPWPSALSRWDSRNNRLAWHGLHGDGFRERVADTIATVGAERVGLVLGTSTSSIECTEEAYRSLTADGGLHPVLAERAVHHPHGTAAFLAEVLDIRGPVLTISTACSSSAKAFAAASRWLDCEIVDAVLVAGVDSLCRSTIFGFHSLQLLSPRVCRPFDATRDGLNIGEAAAFALLTREAPECPAARLLGYGESCDAYHMSSPHPEGVGARLAMEHALGRAGISAADVGYANLHGTGTRSNDAIESIALASVLPPGVPASSTKGWTGHALGAAGIVEAVLVIDALLTGCVPGNLNLETLGSDVAYQVTSQNVDARIDFALSNSFGFGGNNCALVFGRAD